MNQAIHKYQLAIRDTEINLPCGAKPLCIQMQNGLPCLWAIVDPSAIEESVKVICRGTGHEFQGNEDYYLGTVQESGGALIWHFFTEKQIEDRVQLEPARENVAV